jgi:hypothetical protein
MKKQIQDKMNEFGIDGKVTRAKKVSFSDLARASVTEITIEGWKPCKENEALKQYAKTIGVILNFKGSF